MLPFVRDINVPGDLGNTPLHYAVLKNHVEVAGFLLHHGADINRKNDYDDTPLELMNENPDFEAIIREQKSLE
jgi:ankyrin repeat protein